MVRNSELSMSQCISDPYQYVNQIIENALKETEHILLKLKTQRDDTVLNVKNKTGPSEISSFFYNQKKNKIVIE